MSVATLLGVSKVNYSKLKLPPFLPQSCPMEKEDESSLHQEENKPKSEDSDVNYSSEFDSEVEGWSDERNNVPKKIPLPSTSKKVPKAAIPKTTPCDSKETKRCSKKILAKKKKKKKKRSPSPEPPPVSLDKFLKRSDATITKLQKCIENLEMELKQLQEENRGLKRLQAKEERELESHERTSISSLLQAYTEEEANLCHMVKRHSEENREMERRVDMKRQEAALLQRELGEDRPVGRTSNGAELEFRHVMAGLESQLQEKTKAEKAQRRVADQLEKKLKQELQKEHDIYRLARQKLFRIREEAAGVKNLIEKKEEELQLLISAVLSDHPNECIQLMKELRLSPPLLPEDEVSNPNLGHDPS